MRRFAAALLGQPEPALLALAAALASWPPLSAGERQGLVAALGALGFVVLAAGLLARYPMFVAAALGFLCGEFVLARLFHAGSLEVGSPAFAVGLILVAELAYAAVESIGRVTADPRVRLRRAGGLTAVATGTLAAGAVVLVVASRRASTSLVLEAIGLAAAVGVVLTLTALARRTDARERR